MLASTQTPKTQPVAKAAATETDPDADGPSAIAVETANKPILSPAEMFSCLSTQFNKATSRKTRIGIFDFYTSLISTLGMNFAETNYVTIVKHFFTEIVTTPRPPGARDDSVLIIKLVGIILRDLIGIRLLSEQGQISAIQELSSSYLKKWPALMPGQIAPDSPVLVIALKEVAGLVQQLGNAPPPVQEAIADPLVTLLGHPSLDTRVAAAWALRNFCYAAPLRIPKIVLSVLELVQRDMATIATPTAPSDIATRSIGHAYGLGALFSVIPERPLYVSADLSAKVFDTATQLLRRAGEHDMHVASVEIEVAWTIIAALMALGPSFVRANLPQLLVLWRNALPKPTTKDTSSNRDMEQWSFLLHVRSCALGAVRAFLQHNTQVLASRDVVRRLAGLLGNALALANAFVTSQTPASGPGGSPNTNNLGIVDPSATLAVTREALLRRLIYQCFAHVGYTSLPEATQMSLLQSTSALFSSPEGFQGSALQAAIASAGNFTSLWNTTDGYAYGVTTLSVTEDEDALTSAGSLPGQRDKLNRDSIEAKIDSLVSSFRSCSFYAYVPHRRVQITQPVIGSCEYDALMLCHAQAGVSELEWPEPPPPSTAVVDAAIELFAALLPLQDVTSCKAVVRDVIESTRSPKLEKNAGRKAAVVVNSTIALTLTLRVAASSSSRQTRDSFGSTQIGDLLSSFLKVSTSLVFLFH